MIAKSQECHAVSLFDGQVEVVALSSYEEKEEQFKEQVCVSKMAGTYVVCIKFHLFLERFNFLLKLRLLVCDNGSCILLHRVVLLETEGE